MMLPALYCLIAFLFGMALVVDVHTLWGLVVGDSLEDAVSAVLGYLYVEK